MSKIYKGYELIKEIAEGNIPNGTRFKAEYCTFVARDGYLFDEYNGKDQKYATSFQLVWDFELIEEPAIDIDSIEEIDEANPYIETTDKKINELIKAVKQLNKTKEDKVK